MYTPLILTVIVGIATVAMQVGAYHLGRYCARKNPQYIKDVEELHRLQCLNTRLQNAESKLDKAHESFNEVITHIQEVK